MKLSFIYKSSFDKANRSSLTSYRGPGFEKGLMILEKVKKQIGVPILTDVHEDTPLLEVASVLSMYCKPQLFYAVKLILFKKLQHWLSL